MLVAEDDEACVRAREDAVDEIGGRVLLSR